MSLLDWTRLEVEAIVADYLKMLSLELAGQSFSKTAHRRALQQKLNGRSDGSIEFKHCNISAVMIDLGFPNIWAAAGSVDTGLSFLSLLELYGTEISERRMPTRRVVEALDVIEHV